MPRRPTPAAVLKARTRTKAKKAPPKPKPIPPADPLSTLTRSLDACRRVFRLQGVTCRDWENFTTRYRDTKAPLLEAIGGKAGRLLIEAPPAVTTYEEVITNARNHVSAALADSITRQDVAANAVDKDSPLTKYAPAGTSLSRAIAAFAKANKFYGDPSIWPPRVLGDGSLTGGGFFVISANMLDIIMMSESACYRSCHTISDGAYRSGPLQYLFDPHTAIAYFYTDLRKHTPTGLTLPYKLYRQLLFFDLSSHHCGLSYPYGNTRRPTQMNLLYEAIAKILGLDKTNFTYSPGSTAAVDRGANIVHFDGITSQVRPMTPAPQGWKIKLSPTIPCASCGGAIKDHHVLGCGRCGDGKSKKCAVCNEHSHGDDMTNVAGKNVCEACAGKICNCEKCGDTYLPDDKKEYSAGDFCDTCYAEKSLCEDCHKAQKSPAELFDHCSRVDAQYDRTAVCKDCLEKLKDANCLLCSEPELVTEMKHMRVRVGFGIRKAGYLCKECQETKKTKPKSLAAHKADITRKALHRQTASSEINYVVHDGKMHVLI